MNLQTTAGRCVITVTCTATLAQLQFELTASMLEIYNEECYDLLVDGVARSTKLDIKVGSGHVEVPGLSGHVIVDTEQVGVLRQIQL